MNNQEFITKSSIETQKLGQTFAQDFKGGEILCLTGDLGAGKTTFTQGLLKGLRVKGPYTSPTFAIIKHYRGAWSVERGTNKRRPTLRVPSYALCDVYHIDAYRISAKDLLELGFDDFAGKENTVTIIEWPENVKKIIPTSAVWIKFEWLSEKERKITIQ